MWCVSCNRKGVNKWSPCSWSLTLNPYHSVVGYAKWFIHCFIHLLSTKPINPTKKCQRTFFMELNIFGPEQWQSEWQLTDVSTKTTNVKHNGYIHLREDEDYILCCIFVHLDFSKIVCLSGRVGVTCDAVS